MPDEIFKYPDFPKEGEKPAGAIRYSVEEENILEYITKRIGEMKEHRKKKRQGVEIENIWAMADKAYPPHTLGDKGRKVIFTDEEAGMRGRRIELGRDDWQSDASLSFVMAKIQAALSILTANNPKATFRAIDRRYKASSAVMKATYERNWDINKSRIAFLQKFIFNLAKYGTAVGMIGIADRFGEQEVIRRNINPFNAWFNENAKPFESDTFTECVRREIYDKDTFLDAFGDMERAKQIPVRDGLMSQDEDKEGSSEVSGYELEIYENKNRDLLAVKANDELLYYDKLPIEDKFGNKFLSMYMIPWIMRHDEIIEGIGLCEILKGSHSLLNKVRNMTVDQLVMSIYKAGFYSGTDQLDGNGEIIIKPGVYNQISNAKDLTTINIPGPGAEAWKGIEMLKNDEEEESGITRQLMGGIESGKTAFEVSQAKEAALKRLNIPLDSIKFALETDAYLSCKVISTIYSIPKLEKIAGEDKIREYIAEVKGDVSAYEWKQGEEGGEPEFQSKKYRDIELNLKKNEKGEYEEDKQSDFIKLKPEDYEWEGMVSVKAKSILSVSEELEKQIESEFIVKLTELFKGPVELFGKPARQLCAIYDKEPKDYLPDEWIAFLEPKQQEGLVVDQSPAPEQNNSLFVDQPQIANKQNQQAPMNNGNLAQKMMGMLNPFKK